MLPCQSEPLSAPVQCFLPNFLHATTLPLKRDPRQLVPLFACRTNSYCNACNAYTGDHIGTTSISISLPALPSSSGCRSCGALVRSNSEGSKGAPLAVEFKRLLEEKG